MQVKKLSSRSVKEELARVAVKLYNEGLGCYQIAKVISFEVGRHYSADQIRKMLKKRKKRRGSKEIDFFG
ncbi:MAG: hypothetical protein QW079_02130 [Nitrososphaerota archaeon]